MTYRYDPLTDTATDEGTTATMTGTLGETVVYPPCQRGNPMHGNPHDFQGYEPPLGGTPLLYCRQCGQIRKLEYEE